MSNLLLQVVVIAGIVLLVSALIPIRKIRGMLPDGWPRRTWAALAVLIVLGVAGHVAFLWANSTEGANHHEDWLIGWTFLTGSVFVFGVCVLSQYTARALSRIGELELAAKVDGLTQLHTRAHILTLLAKECSRARLLTTPVSVLLLDIDGFKAINDNHGHIVGDCVLAQLGRMMAEAAEGFDLIGRYGGEEFLIVLPDTTPFHAMKIAERVRAAVENKTMPVNEALRVAATVSIGTATSMTFRENGAELILAADQALYQAKKEGRNRVCCAAERYEGDVEFVAA